jgi:hypothetical protein
VALFGWTGELQSAGFPKLLECVIELVGRPAIEVQLDGRFDTPWPSRIRRPFLQSAFTWLIQNGIGIPRHCGDLTGINLGLPRVGAAVAGVE